MLIDWFTVAVQIVNFLILICLLKRFLYGPLIRALDKRQKAIAESLAEATQARLEAAAQMTALAWEKIALDNSRKELLRQAASEVDAWREAALVRLREEIDGSRRRWQQQLTDEQSAFFEKLQLRIGQQVMRVAGKVLADLADDRLEARIVGVFLAKIGTDHDLGAGQRPEAGEFLVATGRALNPEVREGLRNELSARFGAEKSIIFKEEPGLGFGLRMTVGDQAWEWNLAHYMEGLEQDIRQALTLVRKPGKIDE